MNNGAKTQYLQLFAWVLSLGVMAIAFVAWGDSMRWRVVGVSNYRLFPLFGLLAFSLMWAHYIVAATRVWLGIDRGVTKNYFEITSLLVLLAILAHPGLLWWQLWRDGLGLPPGSYMNNYVAPGMAWVATLGTISLCVFLIYELRRIYGQKPWWRYVQYGSDAAMLAILYHSLRLGSNLQRGWLKTVWIFYGVTLILALVYIYVQKFRSVRKPVAKAGTNTP